MNNEPRCHHVREGRRLLYVPGCYSGAVDGPERCVCDTLENRLDRANDRLELTRRRAAAAEEELRRLRQYIDRLRAALRRTPKEYRRLPPLRLFSRD